jgi:hypothetical protein
MNNFHLLPSQWAELPRREKAIIIAGIDLRVEEENRQEKKAKAAASRVKH